MRFTWLGILFHVTILLWLFEEQRPTYSRSPVCRLNRTTSRLLLFVIPGLSYEHRGFLRELDGSHLWVTVSPLATPEISLVSGVKTSVLFPTTLDTIFSHVNATFFAGRRSVAYSNDWIKMDEPHYMRVKGARGERAEIDAMEDFLVRAYSNAVLESQIRSKKVVFYLRFDRLFTSRHTPSKIHKAVRDVISFTKAVNAYYRDNLTNAVLWGDGPGPLIIWGPDIVNNYFKRIVNAFEVTPLLAALLNIEVPSDSSGTLPYEFLKHKKTRARAAYCTAQQLGIRATSLQERNLFDSNDTFRHKNYFRKLKICGKILQKGQFESSLNCSAQLMRKSLKGGQNIEKSERQSSVWGKGLTILAWMALLCSEIALLAHDLTPQRPSWYLYLHSFFLVLLAATFVAYSLIGWNHFKLMYFTVTITMFWMFASRFHIWYPILKTVTISDAVKAMLFCTLLSVASIHAQSSLTSVWMPFGLCVLAINLTLPRYSSSPIVVTYAWWTLCLMFLLCLSLSPCDSPSTKLINFGGTIWLCLSGFASFWLRPVKDLALCAFMALSVACAMLLQYSAVTSSKFHEINFVGLLFFLAPLLPLTGEMKKTNRIIHVAVSSAVGIVLTSPCMESLSYLVCLLICFLWSVLEEYKSHRHGLFTFETCRRGISLSVLLVTSDRVTKSIPFVDIRFLDASVFLTVCLYRQILVLGSLLSVFFIMVPIKQAQAAFTVAQFITTIASIRSAYFPVEGWYDIHQFGIALVFAYYFARIMGKIQMKINENGIPYGQNIEE